MTKIVEQIQLFNRAFKVAWDLAVHDQNLSTNLGPRLSENIRVLIRAGATDPAVIGEEAFKAVSGH